MYSYIIDRSNIYRELSNFTTELLQVGDSKYELNEKGDKLLKCCGTSFNEIKFGLKYDNMSGFLYNVCGQANKLLKPEDIPLYGMDGTVKNISDRTRTNRPINSIDVLVGVRQNMTVCIRLDLLLEKFESDEPTMLNLFTKSTKISAWKLICDYSETLYSDPLCSGEFDINVSEEAMNLLGKIDLSVMSDVELIRLNHERINIGDNKFLYTKYLNKGQTITTNSLYIDPDQCKLYKIMIKL